jgi:hypothetical protein
MVMVWWWWWLWSGRKLSEFPADIFKDDQEVSTLKNEGQKGTSLFSKEAWR